MNQEQNRRKGPLKLILPAPEGGRTRRQRYLTYFLAVIAAAFILFYIPIPYLIFQPGSAENARSMVQVKEGNGEEKGEFLLTTVRMSYANMIGFLMALGDPHAEIMRKSDFFQEGESGQEYTQRQQYYMLSSQSDAIQAAYRQAGVKYRIVSKGVVVLSVEEGMPADGILQSGDRLLEVDGFRVQKLDELLSYLAQKKEGDRVTVAYERNGEKKKADLHLARLSGQSSDTGRPRAGMGVFLGELRDIQAEDPRYEVKISAGEIGGPSAGLIFALEIYNQLVEEDITKGYRIAGTGMIDPYGNVGVIGGIRHKVVAAHERGAEIFLTPPDWYPEEGEPYEPILNATIAKETASQIGTDMKIIEVHTLQAALNALQNLPPKNSQSEGRS